MKSILIKITLVLLSLTILCKGENVFQVSNLENDEISKKINLDEIYSDKKLGSFVENGKTFFRLFAPNALEVKLCTFKEVGNLTGPEHIMKKDENGVWEYQISGDQTGLYYGYKVRHKDNLEAHDLPLCVDPYAKAVATYTTYMNPRKSIVYTKEYDWEDDKWIQRDWRDLIIYEMHIRDMTAHNTSGAKQHGTYAGLTEKGIVGGIDYIKNLGVNTVELLPAMEFGNVEIPFKDSLAGKYNTWNPYERNHWGYMTSNFFAPAAYYAEDWDHLKHETWMGVDGNQVDEFKNMVKAFHKEGIGVIMDVVYNHLSEYEIGNLKQIDKEYYFRLNEDGSFIAESYCGNDLKTERPMMRRLIVESILFWMKEYNIDGFRFDLGKLIDWETIEEIIHEARKVNPNVVFVCEPWGGGYDPQGFSLRDWGAWNDQIRNGIKGENPKQNQGWIFGKWFGNNSPKRIRSYVNGTLVRDSLGLFQKPDHSVNYLESHDGYTLGDFIRIGNGDVASDQVIDDVDQHVKLSAKQLKQNKLAALFLFTSQGITMIHSGQEFARTKVIPKDIDVDDPHKGMIDHNTYDKDNEVNYINYKHAESNKELFDYYKGLIELRKSIPAFRQAKYEDISFFDTKNNEFAIGYSISFKDNIYLILMNADQNNFYQFQLPPGKWEIIVNKEKAGLHNLEEIENSIEVENISGVVLRKK